MIVHKHFSNCFWNEIICMRAEKKVRRVLEMIVINCDFIWYGCAPSTDNSFINFIYKNGNLFPLPAFFFLRRTPEIGIIRLLLLGTVAASAKLKLK